jgi:hypothetical protein
MHKRQTSLRRPLPSSASGSLAHRRVLGASLGLCLGLTGCSAVPRVNVAASGSETTEAGGSVELRVRLATRPSGPIEVYAVSSNTAEARVSDALIITPARYQDTFVITVTGSDDAVPDGDVAYDVQVFARPTQPASAHPQQVATLRLTNRDDDRARFEVLGDLPGGVSASYAFDVSAAGDVVVGASADESGERAVRYTGGVLSALPGTAAHAYGVSPDGALVTGRAQDPAIDPAVYGGAVLWRGDGAPEPLGGAPYYSPGVPVFLMREGRAVTDQGYVVGSCEQNMAYGDPFACRARVGAELAVGPGGRLYATDGVHEAGEGVPDRHAPPHTWPTFDGTDLGFVPGVTCTVTSGCFGAARDFALSGARVVGTSRVPVAEGMGDVAFVYTPADGVRPLLDLPGGVDASGALAVSADGRVIAGFCSDERGRVACVWADGVPQALEDVVLATGGEVPDDYAALEVTALSADARVLVGNGERADGTPEAFRAVLAAAL